MNKLSVSLAFGDSKDKEGTPLKLIVNAVKQS